MRRINIEKSWYEMLRTEFDSQYMADLSKFLREEKKSGKIIYPRGGLIFNALNLTPFDNVKVVMIGQDPYHGKNQATGLSFSVSDRIQKPPSLLNVFRELKDDLKIPIPEHGNLSSWASQGVLLLNSCLTVEHGKPGSHKDRGWEKFTDAIIQKLAVEKTNLVFILWGRLARLKGQQISRQKHRVIESAHPSPLSAHNGFFGSKPFSKTNDYLKVNNLSEINWSLN